MDEVIGVDRSLWKITIVGVITACAAGWLGYAVDHGQTLYGVIAAGVFALLLIVQSMTIHSGRLIGTIVIAQGAIVVVFGFWRTGITNATLLGGLATVALLTIASWRGQSYATRTLAVSSREAGNVVTPLTMTAISLMATIVLVGTMSANGLILSREMIEGFLKPGEWIVQKFAPGFALQGTLQDVVRASSETLVKGGLGGLPESAQDELINAAAGQLQETISDMFGASVRRTDTIIDIIGRVANAKLEKIPENLHTSVWLGVGLLVFLTIKGFGALLGLLVGIAAAALYQLLLLTGFMRVGLETRQKEVVVL